MAVQVTIFANPTYTKSTMTTFGERFRKHRLSKDVSGYRLAMEYGIPESTLYSVEKDKRAFSDDILRKIASVPELELTFDQLKAWQILGKATPSELRYLMRELDAIKQNHEQQS